MAEEKINWFSHDVEFPKTGYVHFYAIEKDNSAFFYPIPNLFTDLNELAEVAIENIESLKADSAPVLNDTLVVPLVYDSLYPQKKSFWTSPKNDFHKIISTTDHLYSLTNEPNSIQAIVVCSYVDTENEQNLFSWSNFYKPSKNNSLLEAGIKASSSPADVRVKYCGIYQALYPFGFDPYTQTIREGKSKAYKPNLLVE